MPPDTTPTAGCDGDMCKTAADEAVRKVFAILGVDIEVPAEVEEFRKDLRFGQSLRKIADRGAVAAFAAITTGLVAALWVGITAKLGGK